MYKVKVTSWRAWVCIYGHMVCAAVAAIASFFAFWTCARAKERERGFSERASLRKFWEVARVA